MYLGAAVLLWLVRAWKIGDLERKAAKDARVNRKNEGETRQEEHVQTSTFAKRVFMVRRV
jgi:hypothetical protein